MMQVTIKNIRFLALTLCVALGLVLGGSLVFADSHELEIEVESEDAGVEVEIQYVGGDEEELTFEDLEITEEEAIIDAIVDATDLTEEEVEAVIEFEAEDEEDDDDVSSSNLEAMLEQIQSLMALIEDLKEQIAESRQAMREVRAELRELRQGMSGDDIRQIQEILATDPDIYPEGLTTGYFGPLTSQALGRFQTKFGLDVTGTVDEDTKEALEELLSERFPDGSIPPGLLRAPGIAKKIQAHMDEDGNVEIDCDGKVRARGLFCPTDEDEEEDEDEDEEDEDENEEEENAQEAIDDANDAIEVAAEDIDNAEGDISAVENMLEDAGELLSDAEEAFDDEDFEEAADLANEAEELADDIRDVLDGDDDDRIIAITATVGVDDTEVETEDNDGDTDTFTVSETDTDAVTEAVADETGLPESYVEEIIDFN